MTHTVKDDDPMVRLRLADPVDPEELERAIAPLRSGVMRGAIERGSLPTQPIPAGDGVAVLFGARTGRGGRRGRRRRLSFVFAALACAAVLAAVIVVSGGSIDSIRQGARPAFADAAVKVAEANPRLLITAPGWRIVEAKSFRTQYGQLIFGDGHHQLNLGWMPAFNRQKMLGRERPGAGRSWTSTIGGHELAMTRLKELKAGNYFSTVLPAEDGVFVFLDGWFATRSEWEELMASVRPVDVEAWLDAMPAEVLRPEMLPSEVARVLRGVPVPPGFDASAVLTETVLTNRFQAAKKLTQAVTCEWVQRWSAARRSGNGAIAQEAAEAMSGARHWPVLWRMAREKGYRGWPTSILAIGRQMAAGDLERERALTVVHGDLVGAGFRIPKGVSPPDAVSCFPRAS